MSLLSDLQTIAESCGVSVETGVFSGKAPDTYLVITPLSDNFELHADNAPRLRNAGGTAVPLHKGQLHQTEKCTRPCLAGCRFLYYRPPVHRL